MHYTKFKVKGVYMLGDKIRYIRKLRNMTVTEVAEKAGINQSYLSNIETNNKTNPSKAVLDGIAKALDIPPEILYSDEIKVEDLAKALAYKNQDINWPGSNVPVSCNTEVLKPAPIFMADSFREGFLQEIYGFDCLPKDDSDSFFEVEVPDNSLEEIDIKKGDFVIVKYQVDAESGDIAVLSVDGKLYIRRINKVDSNIVLTALSKDIPPVIISSIHNVSIIGVVIGAKIFFSNKHNMP